MPEASSIPADIMSPPEKVPVDFLSRPASQGPTCPPRLATELISAIPPAAAAPVRKVGGMAQKGPCADFTPDHATQSAARTIQGCCSFAARKKKTDAVSIDPTTCQRRSPVRSEL